MAFDDWEIIITLIIAVYGAVISTIKVLYDRSKQTRKLKVKLSYGFISQGGVLEPEANYNYSI